jgi:hypothetical protein
MIEFNINKKLFEFKYLPEYASWLLAHKLEEFVTVGIRYCREVDLPLLKPLGKYSEKELVNLSLDANKKILEALIENKIADHIEANTNNWINNKLVVIDKTDVVAEDLTLVFYLRRKNFAYFLDAYTKNVVLQKLIIGELDDYTTQEELISYNVYLKMQQESLLFYKELLLEAQELGGIGSFLINFRDDTKSIYTPEYKRIFEFEEKTTISNFLQWVHPDDRQKVLDIIQTTHSTGGKYEIEYRYKKDSSEKRIWSKGFAITQNAEPLLIRGIVKEITE